MPVRSRSTPSRLAKLFRYWSSGNTVGKKTASSPLWLAVVLSPIEVSESRMRRTLVGCSCKGEILIPLGALTTREAPNRTTTLDTSSVSPSLEVLLFRAQKLTKRTIRYRRAKRVHRRQKKVDRQPTSKKDPPRSDADTCKGCKL